eukprot:CAMPEP_0196999594 /NCGR_PEP_ID=MMETSP1380-20130617/4737_1 /TAXON_ID=5936 /ORGANISM="Euplotes crassus, Strain CT5" /LENGTH=679 /DNA_ID=CAMNT_0042416571 /DNA_START=8 /DNA_END=2047 /DNA_ORIENTATION=+
MSHEIALKRLNMLKGHFRPSKDLKRELSTSTFNLSKAQESLWNTLPANYFETFECISELHGIPDPSLYNAEKDELRKDSNEFIIRLTNKMFEKGFTTPEKIAENIDAFNSGMISLGSFNFATCTRYLVQYGLYCKTIKNLGTERHHQELIDGCSLKTLGCFGLTEMGHGSNVRGIEITATYDKTTKEFILNSPTKTAIKFWIGALAKSAHNAVIFAQLYINENGQKVRKGVHAFVLPIRDRMTHTSFPGVEIGDCGYKKGLNGIDNGWIKFEDYRIPRESLLNRFADVTEDGVYQTAIESEGKRFGNSMSSLSGGRVFISRMSSEISLQSLSIAIRYAAVRRQFGPSDEETLLLDYPLHQYRLFTRFAEHFVHYLGANRLVKMWDKNLPKLLDEGNEQTEVIHALSSSMKAFVSWSSQSTIDECRKACGGHGYSFYSLFANILNFNDLHATWEGDSHVLTMQNQKFILNGIRKALKGKKVPETLEYLSLAQTTPPAFKGDFENIDELAKLFAQRASFLANKAAKALNEYEGGFEQGFLDLQSFELKDMSSAYHDNYCIETFRAFLTTVDDESVRSIFEKLLLLNFYTKMHNDGNFFVAALGLSQFEKLKKHINKSLKHLRKNIILLTQVLPFPERSMGALGHGDLQVYDRYLQHIKACKGVTERASWWKLAYTNSEQKN